MLKSPNLHHNHFCSWLKNNSKQCGIENIIKKYKTTTYVFQNQNSSSPSSSMGSFPK